MTKQILILNLKSYWTENRSFNAIIENYNQSGSHHMTLHCGGNVTTPPPEVWDCGYNITGKIFFITMCW